MTALVVLVTVVSAIAALMVLLDVATRPQHIDIYMVNRARMRRIGERSNG